MSSLAVNDAMPEKHSHIALSTPKATKQNTNTQNETGEDIGAGVTNEEPSDDNHSAHQSFTAASPPTMPHLISNHDHVSARDSIIDEKPGAAIDLTERGRPVSPNQAAPNINPSNVNHGTSKDDVNPFASTSMAAAAKKFWAKGKHEPMNKRQDKKCTEDVMEEVQELIDLFQAPKGLVEITIPSGKKFILHIDVLAEKCDYFRAALAGNFLETNTKQLTLTDVSDNTFGFFLKWLYGGNLKPDHDPNRCHVHNESSLSLPGFFDLWFFADYLRAPALQNHVIINIVDKFQNFLHQPTDERLKRISESIRILWKPKERTDRGELAKPLRDLIIDFVGNPQYMPKAKAEKLIKVLPASFIREYALASVERNFAIEAKTDMVMEMLTSPDELDSVEGLMLDSQFEDIYEKVDLATDSVVNLRCVWQIKPEKYFVKEVKKDQEKK